MTRAKALWWAIPLASALVALAATMYGALEWDSLYGTNPAAMELEAYHHLGLVQLGCILILLREF